MKLRGFALPLLALLLAACGEEPAEPARSAPRISLSDCELEGIGHNARCGELEVPENPGAPAGRKIRLHIAVLPALSGTPKPDPVFVLAGGPGQAATRIAGFSLAFLAKLRRERDLVYVDQRGTGDSNPLDCDLDDGRDALDRIATPELPVGPLRECLAALEADPRYYTTPIAAADFEAVRAALGYPQLNLWGASYGTRVALEYLRQFPARVRSVVLDGVAPVTLKLPLYFPRDGEAALLAAFTDCHRNSACRAAFPQLAEDYETLLARFAQGPLKLRLPHPRKGDQRSVEITRDTVQSTLRAMLYKTDTAALIPLTLKEALKGNYAPLVAQAYAMSDQTEQTLAMGLFLAVACSEELPRITPEEEQREAAHRLLGAGLLSAVKKACALWPRGDVPAAYFEAFKSEVPMLILSGRYDPATPPSWGEEVAKNFPRARHLRANVGHNVSAAGCAPDLITRFVLDADTAKLDTGCLADVMRPPFFVDFAGPPS